jgi:hypothetical protein
MNLEHVSILDRDTGGRTWIEGRSMNQFGSLVFKSFVEPIRAELKDISRLFSIDGAIQIVEQGRVVCRQT